MFFEFIQQLQKVKNFDINFEKVQMVFNTNNSQCSVTSPIHPSRQSLVYELFKDIPNVLMIFILKFLTNLIFF